MNILPIEKILPELRFTFNDHRNIILSAEPGAGKTTRVPLALLNEPWLADQKIVMLEPRRLAARRAAEYMAQQLGEKAGETVGYRMRGESNIGKRTRIEIVTEGVLTRMLQGDAALTGFGLVIFDEFHERSVHADLGLALTLDVQEHVRDDVRILVMSATLDSSSLALMLKTSPFSGGLGDAAVLSSEGKVFPVTTHYISRRTDDPIEPLVVSTILRALREENGDVLVFLPGQREIRKVEILLAEKNLPENTVVHSLFGEAGPEKQRAALAPAPTGKRKVILSTNIAETSLTIDGVRIVIDSGLARSAVFDPRRGMPGLVTLPVSQASADQRRGRAGRQQPGVCYRLWGQHQHAQLPRFSKPEILAADLAPLVLEFAQWGDPDLTGKSLKFLDPPPAAHLSQARELLMQLGAIAGDRHLTNHGTAMAKLPAHPRLAHMMIRGKELGLGALACDVAALLEERDIARGTDASDVALYSRWLLLKEGKNIDHVVRERIQAQAVRLQEILDVHPFAEKHEKSSAEQWRFTPSRQERSLGILLALAYPERVGKRRDKEGLSKGSLSEKYQLAGKTIGVLPKESLLAREEYLAVGDVDGAGNEARIFLAAPLSEGEIREAFADQIEMSDDVHWDERQEEVVSRRVEHFGAIELSEHPLKAQNEKIRAAMIEGIRLMGIDALPWSKDARLFRTRSEWLRIQGFSESDLPDLSDEHLLATLESTEGGLGPSLDGITRRAHLQKLDMGKIVRSFFSFHQLNELDRLAPTHIVVPTGSRILLDYSNEIPILAVRLQEMFGETETPAVAGGKVSVLLHLLSPAHRPIAITQDLPNFWKNAYKEVRKEMRGQYPKHEWPENPLDAKPTKRSKTQKAL
ncbi:MAG: ATP-dependent helicase HrpB [Bacteroidota bacterium]|nr:ATP-dependent helicase HrpB [Bacteroidota bacterium]